MTRSCQLEKIKSKRLLKICRNGVDLLTTDSFFILIYLLKCVLKKNKINDIEWIQTKTIILIKTQLQNVKTFFCYPDFFLSSNWWQSLSFKVYHEIQSIPRNLSKGKWIALEKQVNLAFFIETTFLFLRRKYFYKNLKDKFFYSNFELVKNILSKKEKPSLRCLSALRLILNGEKVDPRLANSIIEFINKNQILIKKYPKYIRGLCLQLYYPIFSLGFERLADTLAELAHKCLDVISKKGESRNIRYLHSTFFSTIGYLANLKNLSKLNPQIRFKIFFGEDTAVANYYFFRTFIVSGSKNIELHSDKKIEKNLCLEEIVTTSKFAQTYENWYRGLSKSINLLNKEKMPREDVEACQKMVIEMWPKFNPNRFVVIHVRDSHYYAGTEHEKLYHADRNSDIRRYLPLVADLNKKGFCVVRIGDEKSVPVNFQHEFFFDYTRCEWKNPALDIFFLSQCAYFIGTNSGPFAIPGLFGRIAFVTNFAPIGNTLGYKNYFYLPKFIKNKMTGKIVTLRKHLEEPFGFTQQLKNSNHRFFYLDNLASDLADLQYDIHPCHFRCKCSIHKKLSKRLSQLNCVTGFNRSLNFPKNFVHKYPNYFFCDEDEINLKIGK